MRRISNAAARFALLGALALLGACAGDDATMGSPVAVADAAAPRPRPPEPSFFSSRPVMPEDSTTIARLRGLALPIAPLQVEDGNVWPAQEGPRATLANPDAALRGIPTYRPGELDRMSAPPPRSQWQPVDPPPPSPMPPGLSGSSSPPPPPIRQQEYPQPAAAAPLSRSSPPPQRADGQVIFTPQGPVTTSGGTDRIRSYNVPGGGGGTAVIDGNTTTLISPGGPAQTIPTQR